MKKLFNLPRTQQDVDFVKQNIAKSKEVELISTRKQRAWEKRERECLERISTQLSLTARSTSAHEPKRTLIADTGAGDDVPNARSGIFHKPINKRYTCPTCAGLGYIPRPPHNEDSCQRNGIAVPAAVECCDQTTDTDAIADRNYLLYCLSKCDMPAVSEEQQLAERVSSSNSGMLKKRESKSSLASRQSAAHFKPLMRAQATQIGKQAVAQERLQLPMTNSCADELTGEFPNAVMRSQSCTSMQLQSFDSEIDVAQQQLASISLTDLPKQTNVDVNADYQPQQPQYEAEPFELFGESNCPVGYRLLSEEERQYALGQAHCQFKLVLNEFNRLPITSATLRVQSRKVELEKELLSIEDDIRLYSQQNVCLMMQQPSR